MSAWWFILCLIAMPLDDMMHQRGNALAARRPVFRIADGDAGLIPKHWMYHLERAGVFRHVQRGLWADSDYWPDPVDIARDFIGSAPLCLLSALHAHGVWKEPNELWVAIGHRDRIPKSDLPIRYVRMSSASLRAGLTERQMSRTRLWVFELEKTLTDCLKFRKTIGAETADRAMRRAIATGRVKRSSLEFHARVCRVQALIAPYLLLLPP